MSNRDRIIVKMGDHWKKILPMMPLGLTPRGTVQVGTDVERVLAMDEEANFVQLDGTGSITPLNQRKVRAAMGLPVGQPLKGYERREVYSIRLEPGLAQYLRELGGDNLSEGVTIAAREHQVRVADAPAQEPDSFQRKVGEPGDSGLAKRRWPKE